MAAVLRQVVCGFRFDHRCIWRAQRPAGAGQRGHGGERRLTGEEALHIVSYTNLDQLYRVQNKEMCRHIYC